VPSRLRADGFSVLRASQEVCAESAEVEGFLSLYLPARLSDTQDCTNTQFQFIHERLQSLHPPLSPQLLVSVPTLGLCFFYF
jgi:hypothetical protein